MLFLVGGDAVRNRRFLSQEGMRKVNVTVVSPKNSTWKPPCLQCHPRGDKSMSLWATYEHIWTRSIASGSEFLTILEDDGIVPSSFDVILDSIYKSMRYLNLKIVWLDSRNALHKGSSICCTVGVVYHRTVLAGLLDDFSQSSPRALWRHYRRKRIKGSSPECLTDHYLANVVHRHGWPSYSFPVVGHPKEPPLSAYMHRRVARCNHKTPTFESPSAQRQRIKTILQSCSSFDPRACRGNGQQLCCWMQKLPQTSSQQLFFHM